MRHIRIKKGEWPSRSGAPLQSVSETPPLRSAAILGADFPGLRPRFEVSENARVDVGQELFRDRKHPEIVVVSPISGRVVSVDHGPRRTLSACIIDADGPAAHHEKSVIPDPDNVRQALLARGFWPAFRTRPFGRMPAPDVSPAAIVVNAVHADPHAPDPQIVLADRQDTFALGLRCLTRLTDGTVFVCQSPGEPLCPDNDRTTCVSFSGSLAAGFASTQIDRLCPATHTRTVWTIGYQDVAAIGHLFLTGNYDAQRVVAISGPAADNPRLVRACLGARLGDLCGSERGVALSGDASSGHRTAYLRRFDTQVTLVPAPSKPPARTWLSRLVSQPKALIPMLPLDRALAIDIPAVPLLRALSVGDSEAAKRLGCLSLVEEDVAALAHRCTSGADYPALLRHVLDDLMAEVT